MKATGQLREEHQGVLLALQILKKIADKLEAGQEVNTQHLDALLEFLKVFVDKCHHAKEEDLLFPALEKVGVPKEGGPMEVMLLEHDDGRYYIKNLTKEVGEYKSGDKQTVSKIVENIRGYADLLSEHIEKEDNILYPMADAHISPKEQKELLTGFDKIEDERIGVGKHEQFHEMLDKLKKIYLG